jgi:hypothetical protein
MAVGVVIVAAALRFDYPSSGISWWDAAAVLLVLPLISVGAAWAVNAAYRRWPAAARRARAPWSAPQTGVAVIVIGAVVALGTALTYLTPVDRITIFLFFGASMVLAAIRGYDGCEILALPNLVLRRTDAVWCPLYTPIDSAERRPNEPSSPLGLGRR